MAETVQLPTTTQVTVQNTVLDIFTYYDATFAEFLQFFIIEILGMVGTVNFAEGELGYSIQALPDFSANVNDQGELVVNDDVVDLYFVDNLGYLINGDMLAPPLADAASNVLDTSFTANWEAVDGAMGYCLDVSTDPYFNTYVTGYQNKDVGNVLTENVTGLTPEVQYYYRVRSYDDNQTSLDSNIIIVTSAIGLGYGALYNYYAVETGLLAPAGWHVPTDEDFNTLATFIEAAATPISNTVGAKLKEIGFTHWDSPNYTIGDNAYGFTFLGAGTRSSNGIANDGIFSQLKTHGYLWSSDQTSDLYGHMMFIDSGNAGLMAYFYDGVGVFRSMNLGLSVRLIKDDSTDPGTMTDYDGNVYNTIKIGNQVWMASNLKVTHYNDGDTIFLVTDDTEWINTVYGSMCWYNNDTSNK